MPAKKLYPRNTVLRVAISEVELASIEQAAKADNTTPSDWALRKLWACNLGSEVAIYFPDDAPKMSQERNNANSKVAQ